jgi:phosphoribosylformylglycinamidine cyclo-ligase
VTTDPGRRRAYRAAGVDVATGERTVELIRAAVESTRRPEQIGVLGGFAAAAGVPAGHRDPVLVSATDGVGTKTAIARAMRRYDTIGIDLVAMCADDVVCSGAAPFLFLDYIAVAQLVPGDVAALVEGVALGCRTAGCALVGGETAEHPGLMAPGEFDLAGFCVGIVERDDLIDGSTVREGDAIVGLAATGIHANGYSLVRAAMADFGLDLDRPYQEQLRRSIGERATGEAMAAEPAHRLATVGDVLLTPTAIYAPALLSLRETLRAAGHDLHGIAHVTGGGLPGNIPRALPAGLGARVDPARWRMPSVFQLIAALAGMEDDEVRATFNAGIGMVVVVPDEAVALVIPTLASRGIAAMRIGEVAAADRLGGRYQEEALSG